MDRLVIDNVQRRDNYHRRERERERDILVSDRGLETPWTRGIIPVNLRDIRRL